MILNIYKPKNWTSFDVVAKLRKSLRTKKIGHAGTLDPLAEGVLIVLTDSDTKKQNEFMKLEKEYLAKIAFGVDSPTYDLEGALTFDKQAFNKKVSLKGLQKKLNEALPKYIGQIEQKVPPYSAVKVKGQRLYKKARKREITESELPTKHVQIYEIKQILLRNISLKNEKISELEGITQTLPVLTCSITCSSGTYIRSLAHDLGKEVGTGAVLVDLIRTRIGEFKIEDSQKLEDLVKG